MLASLQRSGSRRIPAPRLLMDTSAILRKVLLMQILQKQNKTDRMRKKVLHSAFNRNIICVKTARKYFWFVPERNCRFQSGRYSFSQTRSVLQPEFVLGELMLGRLIKLWISNKAVPAKQMSGSSAVCLSSLINDKGNYDQKT